ncbi:hypothetical protein [Tersicoccus sp. Bi-70]|uniref:hypothetical protein n=1 Tax=Tersicoccus sp. Bi-70 TaxID=1897634 RepID=UPI000978A9BB|nr:hypothetical protein [Tersicoccus sp. Bi-70]OMH30675.1 hypothetical protein BGP79_12000 [Tersicoccus sp. Bi-70]
MHHNLPADARERSPQPTAELVINTDDPGGLADVLAYRILEVLSIHRRLDGGIYPVCAHCHDSDGNYLIWPCPTRRALDPQQATV